MLTVLFVTNLCTDGIQCEHILWTAASTFSFEMLNLGVNLCLSLWSLLIKLFMHVMAVCLTFIIEHLSSYVMPSDVLWRFAWAQPYRQEVLTRRHAWCLNECQFSCKALSSREQSTKILSSRKIHHYTESIGKFNEFSKCKNPPYHREHCFYDNLGKVSRWHILVLNFLTTRGHCYRATSIWRSKIMLMKNIGEIVSW